MVEISNPTTLPGAIASGISDLPPVESAADGSILRQVKTFAALLWSPPSRRVLTILGLAILAVICVTVFAQLRLNIWYKDFYNAIEARNLSAFLMQLLVFTAIVIGLLILNVAQTWLNQMIRLRLRERLTRDLVSQWMVPKRDVLLANAGLIGRNPDQRIHEDAHHLAELTTDLTIGLTQAFLLLVSFIGVLWALSAGVRFNIDHNSFMVPGYMVWCAVLYALVGSLLSWAVGRRLVGLNVERYAREADLRFELVRTSENVDGISLYGGEASEAKRLNGEVDRLIVILRKIVGATTRLTWVTAGYGWFAIVIPILAAMPGYFDGLLSFGDLMMVAGAFNQVQQSLRWFVDNFGSLADWRATLRRVMEFRRSLLMLDQASQEKPLIGFAHSASAKLVLENVVVTLIDGNAVLQPSLVEIAPGEHLLIHGKASAGKSCLFRAIAGLWPWGSGMIQVPAEARMAFVPQRPYVQPGSLRESLCYGLVGQHNDAAMVAALKRIGLGHLSGSLGSSARWDKELPLDSQQRLCFARLLLSKPDFIFLDEAFDAVEEDNRPLVFSIFEAELKNAALVCLTRHSSQVPGLRHVAKLIHVARPAPSPDPVSAEHAEPPAVAIGLGLQTADR